ncbi:Phosphoribosylaminoimidazole-succinocarboxamide synthase [bioreactor metagenome]|uniref:phosphoribosylaminoimidazolesuccinocarboxamide synthase n=1 Tax=bioreactor metagenome TaxID=1076179 RepID=A0A645I8V9_9ZZZZ
MYDRYIIIADTKFEFGINDYGEIILIDEVLTPDSSRFWMLDDYNQGKKPMNFDKQILRDYLESIKWNKQPPPPIVPKEVIEKTFEKYQFALNAITK